MTKGVNVITLDAASGISITKNGTKNFYLDADGNIVMSGNITATSGSIGGFTITSSSLYSGKSSLENNTNNGVYIGTNGISLGAVSTDVKTYTSSGSYTTSTVKTPGFRAKSSGEVLCQAIEFPNGAKIETAESYHAASINDGLIESAKLKTYGIYADVLSTRIIEFVNSDKDYMSSIGVSPTSQGEFFIHAYRQVRIDFGRYRDMLLISNTDDNVVDISVSRGKVTINGHDV